MVPQSVRDFLSKVPYDVNRVDRVEAEKALALFNLDAHSQFSEFYLEYEGPFISPRDVAELYDIIVPSSIMESLDYVRDRYGFAENFLPLTSDESEGMYIFDTVNQKVYDFDLENHEDFINGKIKPRWESFNIFLDWYFSEI